MWHHCFCVAEARVRRQRYQQQQQQLLLPQRSKVLDECPANASTARLTLTLQYLTDDTSATPTSSKPVSVQTVTAHAGLSQQYTTGDVTPALHVSSTFRRRKDLSYLEGNHVYGCAPSSQALWAVTPTHSCVCSPRPPQALKQPHAQLL